MADSIKQTLVTEVLQQSLYWSLTLNVEGIFSFTSLQNTKYLIFQKYNAYEFEIRSKYYLNVILILKSY